MTQHSATTRPDRDGFTLIEVTIVILTMGMLMVALSLIVSTIVRTSPGAEARDDDARTLLGLTTYMPEDVNSTPPNNFDFAKATPSGCAGTSPGVNLVRMTWTETASSTDTYRAAYRYRAKGSGYEIVRYTCLDGQTPRIAKMTSALPSINESTWTPGTAPIKITPKVVGGETRGLSLQITTIAGDTLDLEMRTNNPDETLPPVPPNYYAPVPPGNQPPNALPVAVSTPHNTDIDIGLPASDPDGDGLTVTLLGIPAGWPTPTITGLNLTVDPPGSAGVGTIVTFQYRVTDPYGQFAQASVTVTIAPAPANLPPVAGNVTDNAVAGTPLSINLPVSDPDFDPLTVTWSGAHPSLTVLATGTTMTVTSDGSTTNPGSFTYTVSDGALTASGTINLTVTVCNVSSLSPSSATVERRNNGRLKNSVDFTVATSGPCNDLRLEYDNNLDDGYQPVYLSFGAGTTVTVQGHPGGLNWSLGNHTMTLRNGQTGPTLFTSTLTVTP